MAVSGRAEANRDLGRERVGLGIVLHRTQGSASASRSASTTFGSRRKDTGNFFPSLSVTSAKVSTPSVRHEIRLPTNGERADDWISLRESDIGHRIILPPVFEGPCFTVTTNP